MKRYVKSSKSAMELEVNLIDGQFVVDTVFYYTDDIDYALKHGRKDLFENNASYIDNHQGCTIEVVDSSTGETLKSYGI